MKYLNSATVSVVIPCYNEAENIGPCLDALMAQSIKPLEIIVVDNNSTDNTVKIAQTYPGVRVIKEKVQGLIPARDAGMNVAKGEILARIDADTRPTPGWVVRITELMDDENLQACTGTGYFYDFPFKKASLGFRNIFAVKLNRLILGHDMLWGSNMAVRASAWKTIYSQLCDERNIMEDLDIAMHLANEFGTNSLVCDASIRADISVRRGATGLIQNYLYLKMWPDTLKRHIGYRSQLLWPAVAFLTTTAAPFINTVTRVYDGDTNKWTLNRHRLRYKIGYERDNP